MTTQTYAVEGMTCEHCVHAVTEEVTKVSGVTGVTVDLAGRTVAVTGRDVDEQAVRDAVDEAGYTVVG
jgi:copper chaperone CopZ